MAPSHHPAKLLSRLGWLGAGSLLAMTALGATAGGVLADPVYATVDGHYAFDASRNHESWWEDEFDLDDCQKPDELDGLDEPTYVLTENYALVVAKAGSDEFANTYFENANAGETIWADTNGNDTFDGGDKDISHIILCDPFDPQPTPTPDPTPTPTPDPTPTPTPTPDPTPTPTPTPDPSPSPTPESTPDPSPTPTPTPAGGQEAETLPPTDAIGASTPGTADLALVLMLVSGILAGAVVLTPARSRRR